MKELYNYHEKRRIRQRAHMVLLSNKGYPIKEVAEIVGVHRDTVSKHLHNYEEEGVQALYEDERSGRPAKLSEEQREQVAELVGRDASRFGLQSKQVDDGAFVSPYLQDLWDQHLR